MTISIQPDQTAISIPDAVNNARYVNEGLTYQIENLIMKTQEYTKFVKFLSKHKDFIRRFDYSPSKKSVSEHIKLKNAVFDISGTSANVYMCLCAESEEVLHEYWSIYNSYKESSDDVEVIYDTYFMNNGRMESSSKTLDMKEFQDISPLYYPYINTDVMFKRFFTGNENILIVVGEPGLGKSKLSSMAIKHAYSNTEYLPYDKVELSEGADEQYVSVVFVKSPDVLSIDSFWRSLDTARPDIVIVDDLDYMLTKRDSEVQSSDDVRKNNFLNQFLSFTDGVEPNNTKFIITTNQSYQNIDSAALRKGRLFDILELRKLSNEEALAVWEDNNLSKESFFDVFGENDVLQADLGSEIKNRINERNTEQEIPYILEDNISKIITSKTKKSLSI